MAYVSDHKVTKYASAATSTTGVLPAHVSGDLLVAVYQFKSAANDFGTPTGWTTIVNAAGGNNTLHAFYLSASSSSETDPVSTGHTSVTYRSCTTFVIKDAPTSSPIDTAAANSAYQNSSPYKTVPSVAETTTVNNVLCLHFASIDGWNHLQLEPGPMELFSEYVTDGQSGIASAWTFQKTAGAIETFDWLMTRQINDGLSIVIPIKSDAAVIPPRGSLSSPCSTIMMPGSWNNTSGSAGAYSFTSESIIATVPDIDGITTNNGGLGSEVGAGINAYNYNTRINSGTADQIFCYGWTFDDGTMDVSGKKIAFHPYATSGVNASRLAPALNHGIVVGLKSSTNEFAFWDAGGNDTRAQEAKAIVIDDATTIMDETNTFDFTDCTGVAVGGHNVAGADSRIGIDQVQALNSATLIDGSSTRPAKWSTAYENTLSASLFTIEQLGDAYRTKHDIQVGDGGTNAVYFETAGEVLLTPATTDIEFQAASVTLTLYGVSGDTIKINDPVISGNGADTFAIHASSTSAATWDFSGGTISGYGTVTLRDIGTDAYSGLTITGCGRIATNSADLTGVTINDSSDTSSSITPISFADLSALNTAIASLQGSYTNNPSAIQLTYTGVANLTATTDSLPAGLTASGNTVDILLDDGGYDVALTIPVPTGSGWSTHSTTGGGTSSITYSSPTFDLDVAVNVSATIRVFTTGTQTQLATATGTTLTYTHFDETVDITVWKAGYQQQRITGVDLTGANVTQPFTLVDVPAYNASHGLTYGSGNDLTYNRSTLEFDPVTRQTGRDLYSALVDAFDAQSGLHNTDFPIRMDGALTAIFLDDAYIKVADLDNWYGAGYEYRNTSGVVQKQAASFTSSGGTWSGATAEYQTTAGTGQTDARATGKIDEVIVIYTNGGSDLRSHWVWKYQVNGYEQARADIVDLFGGNLEPTEYAFNMAENAIEATTGDPGITAPTFTDHGASPVTWNGKQFSFTLQSNASGEDLLREVNYFHSLDANWEGEPPFNFPDMIKEVVAGTSYETAYGIHEGGTGGSGSPARKGLRVLNAAGDAHPDFTRFQCDDGTYYVAPISASISGSGMPTAAGATTRLQITNVTALSASAWAASTAYSAGDKVLRTTGLGTENTLGLYMVCTTAGTSNDTEPTWDTVVGNTTADTNGTGAGDVVWTTYAVLFYDDDPTTSTYSGTYTNGEEFATGDSWRARFAEMDGASTFKLYATSGVTASSGFSFVVDAEADDVYATNAESGITADAKFEANFSLYYIALEADSDFTAAEAYAYYCYTLCLSQGMAYFWGGVTAVDVANYRINSSTLNLYFDETVGAFVKRTDAARVFRTDGARPALDPTTGGYGIDVGTWQNPVYGYDAGGGGFTSSDRTKLSNVESDTNELQTDWANGGRLDLILDLVLADTNELQTDDIPALIAALNDAPAVSAATIAAAVGSHAYENTETTDELYRLIRAVLVGKVSGGGTGTEVFLGEDGVTPRVTSTNDSDGNRTAVVTDGS